MAVHSTWHTTSHSIAQHRSANGSIAPVATVSPEYGGNKRIRKLNFATFYRSVAHTQLYTYTSTWTVFFFCKQWSVRIKKVAEKLKMWNVFFNMWHIHPLACCLTYWYIHMCMCVYLVPWRHFHRQSSIAAAGSKSRKYKASYQMWKNKKISKRYVCVGCMCVPSISDRMFLYLCAFVQFFSCEIVVFIFFWVSPFY